MNEITEWLLKDILLVLFIIFILNLLGIEFNEYPHSKVKIFGTNCELINEKHCFCVDWTTENYETKLKTINYSFYDENCSGYHQKWINPEENRIIYYIGNELILSDIRSYERSVEIEIIDKEDRSFILFRGKGFP